VHDHTRPVVVFAGGGTGGHLYPALALADELGRLRPDVRAFFVGATRGVEARVLPSLGVEHELLPVEGIARGSRLGALRAIPAFAASLLRMAELLQRLRPAVVVVTGGYAAAPAGIAAGVARIPVVVQEQNAVPGVTSRMIARWARRVHVAFPEAIGKLPARATAKTELSGNPIRAAGAAPRHETRAVFDVPEGCPVMLVTGGSQGSVAVNRVVLEALEAVVSGSLDRPEGLHLLWATGPANFDGVSGGLERLGAPAWVHAVPYLDDMPSAMAAVDFAVSRAGAMSTAELLNHGLPAILIPLPTAASNHQAHNAESLAAASAAVVAPEADLTGTALWAHVERLATDHELRSRMASAARGLARPNAATEIASDIARLLPGVAA
jgi:UDP-N-acetylglucosamine--N-acetylmuramyl-(pentapeptide) pyrophosphoryl-undecaprenol N-acetylglucosamine transferase